MSDPLHIGVLAERRYLAQSQPSGMVAALRARSQKVTVIDPQASAYLLGDHRWLEGLDLVVARGRSLDMLCLLCWAESRGTPTINRKAAIDAVHNKAEMAVALASDRLPTPRTYFGAAAALARGVAGDSYPLILKPVFGDNCRGLQVVANPEAMAGVEWPDPAALAQSYLPTDGYDLKLYGMGDQIWAVRKPSPFNPRRESGGGPPSGALPLTPALTDLGRRCGALFGLELFGVDCIETEAGPLIIEINDFPNYTSVPEADERLAEYVIRRARQERAA